MSNQIPTILKPDYSVFYNVPRLYSYSDLSFFIIIGGRGIGKTTGIAFQLLSDYVKRGYQFVYVRRYIQELPKAEDLFSKIAPSIKIVKGKGRGIYMYTYNKKVIGFAVALTIHTTLKSGINFDRVQTMVYDEAILERGSPYRYLGNEMHAYHELISTIFRHRKGYRVFVLGNNADIFNPYWEYYNIPTFEGIYIDKSRALYCEKAKNSAKLMEIEQETPLYKLTKGTEYWDYHYNNEVLASGRSPNIIPKPVKLKLLCRILLNTYTLNIYRYKLDNIYVELKDKPIKDVYTYIIMENNAPNIYYGNLYKKSDVRRYIEAMFYDNGDYYDSQKTFALMSTFMELI